MAVIVPSGTATQHIGLPPLPQTAFDLLDETIAEVYAEHLADIKHMDDL